MVHSGLLACTSLLYQTYYICSFAELHLCFRSFMFMELGPVSLVKPSSFVHIFSFILTMYNLDHVDS
jgi:hypothetical protein